MTAAEIMAVLRGERSGDVWWAYQLRKFHHTAREGQYIWTILNAKEGLAGYKALKPGDVLLHYARDSGGRKAIIGASGVRGHCQESAMPEGLHYDKQEPGTMGLQVPIDYYDLDLAQSIPVDDIPPDWRIEEGKALLLSLPSSPFRPDGSTRLLGLIHTVSPAFGRKLVELFRGHFATLHPLIGARQQRTHQAL